MDLEARVWRNWSELEKLAQTDPAIVKAIIACDPADEESAGLQAAFPEYYLEGRGPEPLPSQDALRRITAAIGDAEMRAVEIVRVRDIVVSSWFRSSSQSVPVC